MGHGEIWSGLSVWSRKVDRTIGVKTRWWKHSDYYILLITFKVPGKKAVGIPDQKKKEERRIFIVLDKLDRKGVARSWRIIQAEL